MRLLPFVLVAACGGAQNPSTSGDHVPAALAPYGALRWVPDAPSYVISATTVSDGQRAVRDVVDSLGMLARATPDDVSRAAHTMLGLDPLGSDLVQLLGVDPDGGIALFSDDISPTFAVRLAKPDVTRSFFDHLRSIGMHSTTKTIDGVPVESAPLRDGVVASWAVVTSGASDDWFLFHVAIDAFDHGGDPDAWLVHARHHASDAPTWVGEFEWATRLARHAKPLAGFWNAHATLAKLAHLAGDDHGLSSFVGCVAALGAIDRVGVTISGDGHFAEGRIAFGLGAAISTQAILPPPPGFAALANHAALALQWNYALDALATTSMAKCLAAADVGVAELARTGVRAARAAVETFSLDPPGGTGVVAMDLSSRTYVAKLLDEIPSVAFKSERAFGPYKGTHVSIPMVASLDYVLDDRVGLAAIGDNLLDQLVAGTPAAPTPIFALDIRPPALSAATWRSVLDYVVSKGASELLATQLARWNDGHISLAIEHDQDALVLDASGNRR